MPERLTRSEVIVLRLVGEELSNKAIARRLGLALNTVQNHLTSAYRKLGTSNRREAALIVARDYPLISQLPATPMVSTVLAPSDGLALGDDAPGGSNEKDAGWWLSAPPRRWLALAGIILAFAAVGAVITTGLVHMAAGNMTVLADNAPPDATLALDSSSSSRTP